MAIYHQVTNLPQFNKPVLTIGSFDGVHHGHKVILSEVVQAAKAVGGESILITFEPHPRKIIYPDEPLGLLTAPAQKYALILAEGIDHIVVVPFTRDFSLLSAQQYVKEFLLKNFRPEMIVIGYDHHFGHSREGDIGLLRELAAGDTVVEEIPAQLIENAAVSSTKVRNALLAGNVKEAAEMLERPFSLTGTVIHGNKIGRTIGYPTANLKPVYPDILIPKIGIYAVIAEVLGEKHQAMMSIGYRPTVTDEKLITLEVNILDFKGDLYDRELTVHFIDYLRGEEKFDSMEALVRQIARDEINTRQIFSGLPDKNILLKR